MNAMQLIVVERKEALKICASKQTCSRVSTRVRAINNTGTCFRTLPTCFNTLRKKWMRIFQFVYVFTLCRKNVRIRRPSYDSTCVLSMILADMRFQ